MPEKERGFESETACVSALVRVPPVVVRVPLPPRERLLVTCRVPWLNVIPVVKLLVPASVQRPAPLLMIFPPARLVMAPE